MYLILSNNRPNSLFHLFYKLKIIQTFFSYNFNNTKSQVPFLTLVILTTLAAPISQKNILFISLWLNLL
jgi:hypothetical protein